METILLASSVAALLVSVIVLVFCFKILKTVKSATITKDNINRNQGLGDVFSLLKNNLDSVQNNIAIMSSFQKERLDGVNYNIAKLVDNITLSMDKMRNTLDVALKELREDNQSQMEKMREVVDEKLTKNLESRLGRSFNIINEQLEAVHKGLGEMQGLAKGVGDLKSVLTNIKVRGAWGEVQLENILQQLLHPSQYLKQATICNDDNRRVDFAIKLPGKSSSEVLLPIDAKFPLEEYQRLIAASGAFDKQEEERCLKGLAVRIREEAKSISNKYICPPHTTDFAVMYLPIESLYAEALRIDGLVEYLQNNFRIIVCGPTTIGALLNSLQMGFKTFQIETRSRELWDLLNVFKSEFVKFTDALIRTQKKITEAGTNLEIVTRKTVSIQNKLSSVEYEMIE